jgi:hypothetical protein
VDFSYKERNKYFSSSKQVHYGKDHFYICAFRLINVCWILRGGHFSAGKVLATVMLTSTKGMAINYQITKIEKNC